VEVTARDLSKYRLELAEEKLVEEIKGILAGQWAALAGEGDATEDFPEQ